LETASFASQCKLFSSASILVGQHGAGLTNCVFLPKNAKVLEINSPQRPPCKLWCSDVLGYQYHAMLPSKWTWPSRADVAQTQVDGQLFDESLRFVADNMVITGTGQQGVEANSNLLNRLEWMFNTTPGRYNEQQDPRATVRSLCAAEADKMAKSQALQKKPHLVLVSGQGGSGTRQISDFCQRFPSFSIGPLSDAGQDSAIFHLPQSADDFSLFTVASQLKNPFCLVNTSLQKTSSDCHDLDDHALSYWQDGMCQSLQALRSWREVATQLQHMYSSKSP